MRRSSNSSRSRHALVTVSDRLKSWWSQTKHKTENGFHDSTPTKRSPHLPKLLQMTHSVPTWAGLVHQQALVAGGGGSFSWGYQQIVTTGSQLSSSLLVKSLYKYKSSCRFKMTAAVGAALHVVLITGSLWAKLSWGSWARALLFSVSVLNFCSFLLKPVY